MELYATSVVWERTKASRRQIYYWVKKGWLKPVRVHGMAGEGIGTNIVWPLKEIEIARLMAILVVDEKYSPESAAKIVRAEVENS